jgi:hypothetical protein
MARDSHLNGVDAIPPALYSRDVSKAPNEFTTVRARPRFLRGSGRQPESVKRWFTVERTGIARRVIYVSQKPLARWVHERELLKSSRR